MQNRNNIYNSQSNQIPKGFSQQGFGQQQNRQFNNYGNISQAFQENQQIISKPDFTNKGNVIHNNMGDSLRDQKIIEYKIHINSKDRNTSVDKSPFYFKIPFGSTQAFKIDRKINQVKYISVDAVILPKNVAIDVSKASDSKLCPAGSTYLNDSLLSTNPLTTLTANKFLILKIEELTNSRNMSTSDELNSNTFILYHDKSMGIDGTLWRPIHGIIVYPTSQPFILSNMTISLCDFMNNQIKIVDHLGNDIMKSQISEVGKTYLNYIKDNSNSESVVYTDNVIQMSVLLTVGSIENELTINN